jgi:hypothetical protein
MTAQYVVCETKTGATWKYPLTAHSKKCTTIQSKKWAKRVFNGQWEPCNFSAEKFPAAYVAWIEVDGAQTDEASFDICPIGIQRFWFFRGL